MLVVIYLYLEWTKSLGFPGSEAKVQTERTLGGKTVSRAICTLSWQLKQDMQSKYFYYGTLYQYCFLILEMFFIYLSSAEGHDLIPFQTWLHFGERWREIIHFRRNLVSPFVALHWSHINPEQLYDSFVSLVNWQSINLHLSGSKHFQMQCGIVCSFAIWERK